MLIPKNILLGILIIRNERASSRFNVLHKHVPVYIQDAPATILARPQGGSLFVVTTPRQQVREIREVLIL